MRSLKSVNKLGGEEVKDRIEDTDIAIAKRRAAPPSPW